MHARTAVMHALLQESFAESPAACVAFQWETIVGGCFVDFLRSWTDVKCDPIITANFAASGGKYTGADKALIVDFFKQRWLFKEVEW